MYSISLCLEKVKLCLCVPLAIHSSLFKTDGCGNFGCDFNIQLNPLVYTKSLILKGCLFPGVGPSSLLEPVGGKES